MTTVNALSIAKMTAKRSSIALVPAVLALYGVCKTSWPIRRAMESVLYRKEIRKYGFPYTMTQYGFGMHLNPNDRGFSRNILWGKRESFAVDYLTYFLDAKNEVCLDIGANIGYYVNIERTCCECGDIYAFEPVSDTFDILTKNLPTGALAFKLALGDFTGEATINVDKDRNLSTITDNKRSVGTERVNCTTIDAWSKKEGIVPTFLRMDTEGYETKILKGAMGLIQSDVPLKIFMETHPTLTEKGETEQMIADLLENGFKIRKIFLWNTFSDSPLAPLHDVWMKVQSKLEGATINYYGVVPPTEDALKELNERGIGCHLFLER